MRWRSAVWAFALGSLAAQEPVPGQGPSPFDAELPAEVRCEALGALQDRGDLDAAAMLQALSSDNEALQQTAVRILRHEWIEWPELLQKGLSADPRAARAVLTELAVAPRPAVDAWVQRMAISLFPDLRHLALAARLLPPDRKEAEALLRAMANGADEAAVAVPRIPPAIADQLVGVAHELLGGGAEVERLIPWLDRLSPNGTRQLLGLMAALPEERVAPLVDRLAQQDDPAFHERVRAVVDGEIPAERIWLLRAGPLLDTAAERRRVAQLVGDRQVDAALRLTAFDALLDAGHYEPELAQFAQEYGAERWRRMFAARVEGIPDDVVLQALDSDRETQLAVLRSIGQRGSLRAVTGSTSLSPELEHGVLQILRAAARQQDPEAPAVAAARGAARTALVLVGSDAGVEAALDDAGAEPDALRLCYDALGHRHDPIAAAALLAEVTRTRLPAPDAEHARRQHLALVLAELGDRRELDKLLTGLSSRRASFVRRCRHALPTLPEPHWNTVLDLLAATTDPDLRVELLQWIAGCALPAARAALREAFAETGDEAQEVREVALQGLLAGPERGELLAAWRPTAGGDPERDDLFAFAALATMPQPLRPQDVELVQFLLFEQPRRDPREAVRAARSPEGRTGFPVTGAIAALLRRESQAVAAVFAPAARMAAERDVQGLVRQRWLFLWTALQAMPELRVQVGRATAALVLAIPDADDAGAGPAQFYFAQQLAASSAFADAAVAWRRAVALLLRLPHMGMHLRIHLGVRDPDAGFDPHAALAAAPWLASARAAAAAGDLPGARAAAANALELAGADAATRIAADAILGSEEPR
ncbi:MAG: hypothetical protein AB7O97_12955 [Planctomycetota bacterium]